MRTLTIIWIVICSLSSTAQGLDPSSRIQVDSLLNICNSEESEDTAVVNAYLTINGFFYLNMPDSVIYYSRKALLLSKQIHYLYGISQSNGWLGYMYERIGEFEKSVDHNLQGLEATLLLHDYETAATACNNLGSSFQSRGDLLSALNCFHKSLDYYTSINDPGGIAMCLNNIAYVYKQQEDPKRALEFFQKALNARNEVPLNKHNTEYTRLKGINYNNIGITYLNLREYTKALEFIHTGAQISSSISDYNGMATAYLNIGVANYSLAEAIKDSISSSSYDSLLTLAEIYLDSSSYYCDLSGAKRNISSVFISKGKLELLRGNLDKAQQLSERGLDLADSIGYIQNLVHGSGVLHEIYRKQGKFEQSLNTYRLYRLLNDSLTDIKIHQAAEEERSRYEFEMNKAIIDAEHEKSLAIKQDEKELQQIITLATSIILILVLAFLFFVFNRLKITRQQKVLIEEQKQKVEEAHLELEEKNMEIMDSINYAKQIQSAILPPDELIEELLPDSFVLYIPKDVVAGDFYWIEKVGKKILVAAADCTGHGVPGAMVSVICNSALNRSVKEFKLTTTGEILDQARKLVITEFEKSKREVKDGMDVALCCIEGQTVTFTGANNPLWIIRNGAEEVEEIKADKQPVGQFDNSKPFSTNQVKLTQGDQIYFFSDGLVDQFGGPKGKKFKASKLRTILLENADLPMSHQKDKLITAFDSWKGSQEQVDDVCVIGVRIS